MEIFRRGAKNTTPLPLDGGSRSTLSSGAAIPRIAAPATRRGNQSLGGVQGALFKGHSLLAARRLRNSFRGQQRGTELGEADYDPPPREFQFPYPVR